MKKIAVINGPNMDRLGKREPEIYGSATLAQLIGDLRTKAESLGVELADFQSNSEGAIIDKIGELADAGFQSVIMNPGGLTHTSVALRDSVAGSGMKFIEVHISNIYKREGFRHESLTAAASSAVISGMGLDGYFLALEYLAAQK